MREPSFVPTLRFPSAIRGLSVLVLSAACLAAAPAWAANSDPTEVLEPADSLEGNFLAAYIAGAARDTAAATTFFREAVKADPRNLELLERAFIAFLADGAMAEAFQAAEKLVARDKSNGLAQFALGVRALKGRQYKTARSHLGNGGRGRQADVTATLLTAWAHAGAGDGKEALATVDRLKSERAFNQFREYHAALIADLVGNRREADARFKAAYENGKTTLQVADAYGRYLSRRDKKDEAIAVYGEFDATLPRHPLIRAALDDLKAGKILAPTVASAQDGAAEVLYGLGVIGSSQGDDLTAIVYLRLGLHLDPDHPLALVSLADSYERLKQFDRANEIFARIPKASPIRTSADIAIGSNLEQLNRGDEAVAHLEALLKARPDDIEVIMALGNVLRSRKRFAEAAEIYTKAVERIGTPDRGHWILFFYRGTSYERAKQWDKAEADLKKALELVPETQPAGRAQVMNYLAYSWVDAGQNIEDAFKMLQKAVELSPRDGMIIDSLGWAYYRLGRYDDAVRELEKAVELKAGDAVINDHLGDAYWKVGRKLEARFQWTHAKDSNPEHEDLVKILKKIDNGLEEVQPTAAENVPVQPVEASKNGG
jgi:tetratricopeptide (TPR) repeat protein